MNITDPSVMQIHPGLFQACTQRRSTS